MLEPLSAKGTSSSSFGVAVPTEPALTWLERREARPPMPPLGKMIGPARPPPRAPVSRGAVPDDLGEGASRRPVSRRRSRRC